MSTGLSASLRFGPKSSMPSKSSSRTQQSSSAAGGAAPSGGTGGGSSGSRSRRGQAGAADTEAWQAECVRAADQLAAAVPEGDDAAPTSEWRAQLERVLAGARAAAAPPRPAEITDPDAALEELAGADEGAAAQLAPLRVEQKAAEAAVSVLQQELGGRREYAAALEQELAYLNKELEERQREAAEAGDSMSDTRPMVRLTKACAQLRQELVAMDVRTGVLQTAVLRMARTQA